MIVASLKNIKSIIKALQASHIYYLSVHTIPDIGTTGYTQ